MTAAAVIVVVCALVTAFTAVRSYRAAALSRRAGLALTVARLAILLLILAAYFQPVLRLRQLLRGRDSLVLLVDNSASMTLFSPDSISDMVRTVREMVRSLPAEGRPELNVYTFGDSLAALADDRLPGFNGRRSGFPGRVPLPDGIRGGRMLILSDGNWSDAGGLSAGPGFDDCAYLRLPAIRRKPVLTLETSRKTVTTAKGDTSSIQFFFRGYATVRELPLTVYADGRPALRRTILLRDSSFTDTAIIRLPAPSTGRQLLRITADLPDAAAASCFLVRDVVPDRFSAHVYATSAHIDKRFFTIALDSRRDWIRAAASDAGRAHMLVVYDWDARAEKLLAALPARSLAVFAGDLPCRPVETIPADRHRPVRAFAPAGVSPPPFSDLTPLPSVVRCPGPSARRIVPVIALTPPQGDDTLAAVYFTVFGGRDVLALAGTGFWLWDFTSRAFTADSAGECAFSNFILDLAKARLVENLSDALHVFPAQLPLNENEPFSCIVSLPSQLRDEKVDVALRFDAAGGASFDTTFPVIPGMHEKAAVTLPGLSRGTWHMGGRVSSAGRHWSFDDTVTVGADLSEYGVWQQNTMLLDQVARPIAWTDTASLRQITAAAGRQSGETTVERHVRIRQSWPLLLLIGLLLAVEWYVRRRLLLD